MIKLQNPLRSLKQSARYKASWFGGPSNPLRRRKRGPTPRNTADDIIQFAMNKAMKIASGRRVGVRLYKSQPLTQTLDIEAFRVAKGIRVVIMNNNIYNLNPVRADFTFDPKSKRVITINGQVNAHYKNALNRAKFIPARWM